MRARRDLLPIAALLLAIALALPGTVEAQSVSAVVRAEGVAGVMLTDRFRDRFDWGGGGSVRAGLGFLDDYLEVRISGTTLFFPVEGQVPGTLYQFAAGARGNLPIDPVVGGPWLDLDLGGGVTGELPRFVFDVGAGWAFRPAEIFEIGPVVRYTMIVQEDGAAVPDHSHILTFGLEVALRIPIVETVTERVVEAAAQDRDDDGVLDENDECPDEPEDRDGLADADGCPETDHDGDGIEDGSDQCPSAPETANGYLDEDGCPDTEPPPVTTTPEPEAQPLEPRVQFRTGSDHVSPRYIDAIREICAIAEANPNAIIRVVGHADETGTTAGNQRLGAARSGAVTEQLILVCNLPPERIETYSFGDSRVECDDAGSREDARECHARNRRAEFFLVEAQ